MQKTVTAAGSTATSTSAVQAASFSIIVALSVSHFLNDLVQALLPAIYPIIKQSYHLNYEQIGYLTLAFQLTASMLQPLVGIMTDRKPQPFSLVAGMACTFVGVFVLAYATSYALLLLGAAMIGTGSSIFHPESTRMARMASGGRHGFAQSMFQVGGQAGQAVGPLLAAFIIVPRGQTSLSYFSFLALIAMMVLLWVGLWYRQQNPQPVKKKAMGADGGVAKPVAGLLALSIAILTLLMFSKSAYTASLTNYYTFHLIGTFGITVQTSQVLLFLFLVSQAIGALIGGHVGDRIGRRNIMWFSILGALPFTLMLPFANLWTTAVLTMIIGAIMASAFPAILVYAIELMPGKVGMVAGMFYGVSFGLGALSAALLGVLADHIGLDAVYRLCAFLPAIGLLTWFLPEASRVNVKA